MLFLNRSHRVAAICGAAPLLLGTGIFLVWLVVRWDWLIIAGGVVLYGGVAVFAVGVVALVRFCWVACHTRSVPRRRVWVSALGCAGLLLANFPVAAGIVSTAIAVATRYSVVVRNTSQEQLDGVRVFGGGCDATYGSLLPGATASRSFWIQHDDVLGFRASSRTNTIEQTIDPYVTVNSGGHLTVTVERDQKVVVVRQTATQLALLDRIREVFLWLDRSPCVGFNSARVVERDRAASRGLQPGKGTLAPWAPPQTLLVISNEAVAPRVLCDHSGAERGSVVDVGRIGRQ